MSDRIKNSNLPFINLSKENLILIYDALEAEQAGKMIFALTEYIYDGIEPNFETKIEKSVWNNILMLIDRKAESYFKKATANRENGKKGGRPKKNNDITPNEDFDNTLTTGLPKNTEEQQTDTKDETQQQTIDSSVTFDNYSERLYNLIDDNIDKIRQSTDILAQKQIELGSQIDNTVAFHRNVLYELRKQLGWDTKDGIDFQQFIDEEINRKTAQIRYGRAVQSSYNS